MARTERIFKRIVQHRRSHVEDIALFPATPITFRKRIFRYWWDYAAFAVVTASYGMTTISGCL